MRFYLGTHQPHWLKLTTVPLFVSARRLRLGYKKRLPESIGMWALDSGGFTELNKYGRWLVSPYQYAREVRRWMKMIGNMKWAATQDWMCEPFVLRKTELTVEEHQRRSVQSYLKLRELAPNVPWMPVVQGWTVQDYLRCVKMYTAAGVDLVSLPVVGVGSVCRRQGTEEGHRIIYELYTRGLRLHAFGFKLNGLRACAKWLVSADSMAWSFHARYQRKPMFDDCTHRTCANCMKFALKWREKVLRTTRRP